MQFKKAEIEVGDHVAIRAKPFGRTEIEGAISDLEKGVLQLLSTDLIRHNHDGKLTEKEVKRIKVVSPAEKAIFEGSKGNFEKGDCATTTVTGEKKHGEVIAAFNGVVAIKCEDDGHHVMAAHNSFIKD